MDRKLSLNPEFKCIEYDLYDLFDFTSEILGNNIVHGVPHIIRVLNIAYDIVDRLDLDIDYCVLEASIILHDIGRRIGEPHPYYSALLAEPLLKKKKFVESLINNIVNSILYHSYSYSQKHGIKPECEEAKILSDADKLDALGVIGFIRVFCHDPGRNLKNIIKHFHDKILKLPSMMHYEYTRRKANLLKKRIELMLYWLKEELGENLIG